MLAALAIDAVLNPRDEQTSQSGYYVGNDWIEMGRLEMGELAKACAKGKGPSTEVVWLAGVETGAANIYMRHGINEVLAANPDQLNAQRRWKTPLGVTSSLCSEECGLSEGGLLADDTDVARSDQSSPASILLDDQ